MAVQAVSELDAGWESCRRSIPCEVQRDLTAQTLYFDICKPLEAAVHEINLVFQAVRRTSLRQIAILPFV